MLSIPPRETKQMRKDGDNPIRKLKRETRFWNIPLSPERVLVFIPNIIFKTRSFSCREQSLWEQIWLSSQSAALPLSEDIGFWSTSWAWAGLLGCSLRRCLLLQSLKQQHWPNGFWLALFTPLPSTRSYVNVVPTGMCRALQIAVLAAIKQSRELFGWNPNNLKIVMCHNCRVVQNRSGSPGWKGLWWWLERLKQVSEKPQLFALWWQIMTAWLSSPVSSCALFPALNRGDDK